MIIPDPNEVNIPTHLKRANLREAGLVIDQFPFNKSWDEDDLKLNILEQIPVVHRIRDIKFVKACYGKISDFNLPSGVALSGERLLRMTGQGCIYVQKLGECLNPVSQTDFGDESITVDPDDDDDLLMPQPGPSGQTPRETAESHDMLSQLKVIFPDKEVALLEEAVTAAESLNEAVDTILGRSMTLADLLEKFKTTHMVSEEIHLQIRRDHIWRDALQFYKVARADKSRLFKELKVEFLGEDGIDCGALKLEFLQLCLEEAMKNTFEEVNGVKIPKKSAGGLLTYKIVGLMIAHSVIQGGPGISCLPQWCYKYMVSRDFNAAAEYLSKDDIPLNAATASLHTFLDELQEADSDSKLDALLDETSATGEIYQQIINGSSWDITQQVTFQNRCLLIFELIQDEVIRKRIGQINAMCDGLDEIGLMKLASLHPDEFEPLFLPCTQISQCALLDSIYPSTNLSGSQLQSHEWFLRYIQETSSEILTKLLQFSTSLKNIPSTGLLPKITIDFHTDRDRRLPEAFVCVRKLILPICHTSFEEYKSHLNVAFCDNFSGFGNM